MPSSEKTEPGEFLVKIEHAFVVGLKRKAFAALCVAKSMQP
jgi:hypothetical protein